MSRCLSISLVTLFRNLRYYRWHLSWYVISTSQNCVTLFIYARATCMYNIIHIKNSHLRQILRLEPFYLSSILHSLWMVLSYRKRWKWKHSPISRLAHNDTIRSHPILVLLSFPLYQHQLRIPQHKNILVLSSSNI